jgi:hypothetical protein
MERLKILKLIGVVFLTSIFAPPASATLFITADKDLRYSDDEFKVEALGLSLRKVFADEQGDRIILFTFIDSMHNFQETMLEQAYLQYKGPLGKWNLILGRYLLPFGLMPNYSTKRLLIESLEHEMIGIRSDQGVQLSGVIKDFDYAISLSQGVGVRRWTDIDNDWLITIRVGYQGVDFEDLRIGLSGLLGRVLPDEIHSMGEVPKYKQLLALDLIKYYGPLVWRGELTYGEEEDRRLKGIFTGVDYALFPRTDLNLGYTHLNRDGDKKDALTIGLTYNLAGFQIRAAQRLSLGGEQDEFSFQVYRLFTWTF